MKRLNVFLLLALLLGIPYCLQSQQKVDNQKNVSNPIEVISWVPPYGIAACQAAVQANFGTCNVADGLTRLGLQFWTPNTNGTIKYANHEAYTPTDADVQWWKTWAAANNVEVLLCIYNNTGSWDWPLAVSAFANNRTTFINALIAEMDRLGLDGIDLDLEGVGSFDSDRAAFNLFVQELSVELKARGKILTIDTFHYIWNAPNQSWWSDWVGVVDNIHTMGYTDLYEAATTAYGPFSFQQNTGIAAGYAGNVVSMGLPSWVASWGTSSGRGTTAQAHIQEIRYDIQEPTGIAIWDLQLQGWQNSDLWCEIAGLKNETSCPAAGTPCDDGDPNTTNDIQDGNCGCVGTPCQTAGSTCDDNNPCTTGDVFDAACNCAGTIQDADGDGVCDADDVCSGFDDNLIGTTCDDNDACTSNDQFTNNCLCEGTFTDSDADGVCDADDICAGYDDAVDLDMDGTPDGCDACIDSAEAVDGCNATAGTVDLSIANAMGSDYAWYETDVSTTVLGTGTTFTTPSVSNTTTYYVGQAGTFSDIAGPPMTGNGFTGVNDWISSTQMSFDVLQNFTLKSMTFRALIWSGTHTISFEIRDSGNNVVPNGTQSYSITGSGAGPFWHPVTLSNGGVDLTTGSYTLVVTSGVGIGHWSGVNYPVADSYISITGANQAGQILAMHEWEVEGGGGGNCPRIPVVAEIGGSCGASLRLEAKVALQAVYDGTSLMSTALNTSGYLPLQEPYAALGWYNGTGVTTAAVLSTYDVVDWVLVELRDRNSLSTVIEAKVGLLLADGSVVDVDGSSLLTFDAAIDSYNVVIRHRNHLAIMTQNAIDFASTQVVDFRNFPLHGGANASAMVNGTQALWTGDATLDGSINAADRSSTWNNRNTSGYLLADVTMDGSVNAADRSTTWNNRNRVSLVP